MSYQTFEYASCFHNLGEPVYLSNSNVYCLKQQNPFTEFSDLSYCYPFIPVSNLGQLRNDLQLAEQDYQCFYGVLSPWLQVLEQEDIKFFDLFFEYKDHYFTDLRSDVWQVLPDTHKRLIRKSSSRASVSLAQPDLLLDRWLELYGNLVQRHNITGITAFTPSVLRSFLLLPGGFVYSAEIDDCVCGIAIFYPHDHIVYYHLAAYSDEGYSNSVSYAIFWTAIQDLKKLGFKIMHLGGVPGVHGSDSGLQRFKKGWATGVVKSFFCGKILNKHQFQQTQIKAGASYVTDFFPPYRKQLLGW